MTGCKRPGDLRGIRFGDTFRAYPADGFDSFRRRVATVAGPPPHPALTRTMQTDDAARAALDRLSERQRECLRMIAQGLSPKEVAAELQLSVETVHAHLKAARRTLGVTSSREAARLLARSESVVTHGLVMGHADDPTLTRRQDEGIGTPADAGDEVRDPWSGAAPVRNLSFERPRGRLDDLTVVQRAALMVLALVAMAIVLAGLLATASSLQRLLWQIYYGR